MALRRKRCRVSQRNRGATTGPNPASYAYDRARNRTSQAVNGTTTSYGYKAANELTGATTGGATTTYSHDGNGNMTGNSAGLVLAYNAANQTIGATPAGGTALALAYSGGSQAQRVSAGGSGFQHGLLGLTREVNASGTAYYTRGPGGELLGQRTPGGRSYYLYDGLGSTAALTDSAGNVTNRYRYDPHGRQLSATGTTASARFMLPWSLMGVRVADWAYLIAAAVILAIGFVLYRAGLVGNTLAATGLGVSALIAFLAAWAVAGRAAPQIMVPAIALFAAGIFAHWRYILPKNIRRRRGD